MPQAFASSRTAHCDGTAQRYVTYSPKVVSESHGTLPAVLLLHGGGDIPDNVIDAWKKFAKTNSIILLAPDLPRDPKVRGLRSQSFALCSEIRWEDT